jgi:aminoglycoside phosphotransferase (APT) family kinase protein
MEKRVITAADLTKAERFGKFCPVFKIDATTAVKTGDCVRLAEANSMKFVREHTTIPVPKVYNVYKDQDTGHVRIVMEFIEGNRLEDMWDKFDVSQKKIVV